MASPPLTAAAPADRAERRLAAPVFFGVALLAIGAYYLLSGNVQSIWFEVIGASAVIVLLASSRRLTADRTAWTLVGIGLAGEVAGDIASTVYEVGFGHEAPLPSIADVFYLLGYPPLALGIFLFVWRRLGGRVGRATLLDGLIVVSAVATVQWVFVIDQLIREHLSFSAHVVVVAYPLMDVLLLVALIQLISAPAGATRRMSLLTASIALFVAADELFLLNAGSYSSGGWLDSLWLLSYALAGTAGLTAAQPIRETRNTIPRAGPSRLVLLALALLCVPATLMIERFEHHRTHVLVIAVGGAAIAALVMARLASLLHAEAATTKAAVDAEAHLRELDRLKDEFVASVSHELRTPLTSLVGYVEMLAEDTSGGLGPEQRRYVQILERNTERLQALVNDLLFAAGLQRGHLELQHEPVDLTAIVRDMIEATAPTVQAAGLVLEADTGGSAIVVGDAGRLGQLVDNLLSNAVKFTPEGGAITVRVEQRNGSVLVEVADTGIGVPDGEQGRLFERFYRATNAQARAIPGTGLGLHIACAIAQAHGGGIEISSREGEGARFVVELPAAPNQPLAR